MDKKGRPGEVKRRILLAEDSPDAQALMKKSLEKIGFEVAAVSNGELCIEKFTQSEFDLVIIDFVMPKMNGLEVLRTIRKQRSAEELPVIMITARQKKDLVKAAVRNGVSDFVIKPIRSSSFAERIDQHLIQFTQSDLRKILLGLNMPDPTSLSPKLKSIVLSNHLSAYPFEHQGVICCALMKIGKNPHVLARKEEEELKKKVTFLGKGGFLWNVVWPIGEQIPFQLPRDFINDEEDFNRISI